MIYYNTNNITVHNDDVLNRELFKEEFIDLIVTSPPYNLDIDYENSNDNENYEEYLSFTKNWLSNCYNWTNTSGRLCLNIPLDKNKNGQQSIGSDITTIAKEIGWKYHSTIIWNEGNISRRTAWGSWLSASAPYVIAPVELIVILYKDTWKKTNGTKLSDISKEEFMEWTNGLWTFNGESKKRIGHPAPFPKELPKRCIKLFSYIDDVVFDPFSGSGTTLLVSNQLNRKAIGLEISKIYCDLIRNRINKEIKNTLFDGRT